MTEQRSVFLQSVVEEKDVCASINSKKVLQLRTVTHCLAKLQIQMQQFKMLLFPAVLHLTVRTAENACLYHYIYSQPNISVETNDVDFQGLAADAEIESAYPVLPGSSSLTESINISQTQNQIYQRTPAKGIKLFLSMRLFSQKVTLREQEPRIHISESLTANCLPKLSAESLYVSISQCVI